MPVQKKTSRGHSTSVSRNVIPARKGTSKKISKKTRSEHSHAPFTAEELRKISAEISLREQPSPASNILVLMEVDPWNVHAYWHIQASTMDKSRARMKKNGGNPKLVLRFYDVSSKHDQNGFHDRFDIEVKENSNNWYVNLWHDGKHYSAEIGLRSDNGSFEVLASSNQVVMPSAYPSADLDFYSVQARIPTLPEPASKIIPSISNDDLLRNLFPKQLTSGTEFPWVEPPTPPSLQEEPAFVVLNGTASETISETLNFPAIDQRELKTHGTLTRKFRKKILSGTDVPVLDGPPVGMVSPVGVEFDSQPFVPPVLMLLDEALQLNNAEPVNYSREPSHEPDITGIKDGMLSQRFVVLESYIGHSEFSSSTVDDTVKINAKLILEGTCQPGNTLLFFGEPVHVEHDGSFRIELPLKKGSELLEFMYRASIRPIKE